MRTFLEAFMNILELTPDVTFEEAQKASSLKVYRSSARPNKQDYTAGSHAGTKQQALIRADYMLNDEQKYDEYYLYELVVTLDRVYPELVEDTGTDHGYDFTSDIASNYDIAFYKNTGEGDVRRENLSIIVINPKSIQSSKMVETLSKDYLLSIQNELY